jgi:O-antigen/teichoic acid export membrane protein
MILLSKLTNSTAVGYYGAAYKLLAMFTVIAALYAMNILPVLSRFYNTDNLKMKILFGRSLYYLLIFATALAMLTTVYATNIIHLFFGQEFLPAKMSLQILVWSGVVTYAGSLFGATLISIGRQSTGIWVATIGVIVNVAANLFMIPYWSFNGAALATLITELYVCLALGFVLYHYERLSLPVREFAKLAAFVPIMGIIAFCLKGICWMISLPLASLVFFAVGVFLRVINIDEIASFFIEIDRNESRPNYNIYLGE